MVGRTDESGVTLPPLHPRCRCTIMYREVKPTENFLGVEADTIGTHDVLFRKQVIEATKKQLAQYKADLEEYYRRQGGG